MAKHNTPRNFVDLFAGCGGLSLGLEQAGFRPIFVNELNKDAMKTYLVNRREINPLLEKKFHLNDVKELIREGALRDLASGFKQEYGIDTKAGDLDLLVGGPPCQGFSGIGYRRSYSVDKKYLPSNHLYEDMITIIEELRPKIFLFENVRGLMAAKWHKEGVKGEIWEDVKRTFQGLDEYFIRHKLVYAKNYGVPQNRPRVLLVGIRRDINATRSIALVQEDAVDAGFLPRGGKRPPNPTELLGDLVDTNWRPGGSTQRYPSKVMSKIQEELRKHPVTGEIAAAGDELLEHEYSRHAERIIKKFQYMIDHDGKIPPESQTKKFAQRVLPEEWGEDGPHITATSLPDDYVHFKQPRSLTVREWARIQMFPDWYKFEGKRTTGGTRRAGNPQEGLHEREVPKYTQIGNAVPVGLAREVGKHFRTLLER